MASPAESSGASPDREAVAAVLAQCDADFARDLGAAPAELVGFAGKVVKAVHLRMADAVLSLLGATPREDAPNAIQIEMQRRRERAMEEIERHGGRWCDAPACNCGGVHWPYRPRARADEVRELEDALIDVLNQACPGHRNLGTEEKIDSMALSAYADGLRLLARRGLFKIDAEAHRRVIGSWIERGATEPAKEPDEPFTLRRLQDEQRPWVLHNFGTRSAYQPLLGALEELGELAHAHLKGEQGIRHTPEEVAAMKIDAVADVVIYLADYCSGSGIDMHDAVERTWASVRQRDWKASPMRAAAPAPPVMDEPQIIGHNAEALTKAAPVIEMIGRAAKAAAAMGEAAREAPEIPLSARKPSAEENMRWNLRRQLNDKEYRAAIRDLRLVKAEAAERAKENVYGQLEWQERTSFRFDELRAAIMARPR